MVVVISGWSCGYSAADRSVCAIVVVVSSAAVSSVVVVDGSMQSNMGMRVRSDWVSVLMSFFMLFMHLLAASSASLYCVHSWQIVCLDCVGGRPCSYLILHLSPWHGLVVFCFFVV